MSIISWPRKYQVDELYDAYREFQSFSVKLKKSRDISHEGRERVLIAFTAITSGM